MSRYRHVANKNAIFDGIVDIVAGEFEAPTLSGHWKAALCRRTISAHEALVRHPWATMLIVSRVDVAIGCLREAGFAQRAHSKAAAVAN